MGQNLYPLRRTGESYIRLSPDIVDTPDGLHIPRGVFPGSFVVDWSNSGISPKSILGRSYEWALQHLIGVVLGRLNSPGEALSAEVDEGRLLPIAMAGVKTRLPGVLALDPSGFLLS